MAYEDYGMAIGFMFDSEHVKQILNIEIEGKCVQIKTIGEQPGHKQSGQYLWPAASSLCHYFCMFNDFNLNDCSIVEFGSGCGLSGIFCAKYLNPKRVLMTDYDPGSLSLIQDNILLNEVEDIARCLPLEWGNGLAEPWQHSDILMIGSDLIYSRDVVEPLFRAVRSYMDACLDGGAFYLATSFELGEVHILYPLLALSFIYMT